MTWYDVFLQYKSQISNTIKKTVNHKKTKTKNSTKSESKTSKPLFSLKPTTTTRIIFASLMIFQAKKGAKVNVECEGENEQECFNAIKALIDSKFGYNE